MGASTTKRGERQRSLEIERARCAWLIASDLAARACGADVRKVMQTRGVVGRGGDETTSRARKIACYLAVVVGNNTQARLGDAAAIDRATVHAHLEWVEDEREKPAFDAMITGLEQALLRMAVQVVMAHLGDAAGEVAA